MDVLQIVKAKLSETIEDAILEVHIAEVGQAMKTYMNRNDIPRELVFVHANMVIDLISSDSRKSDTDHQQAVTSIKEGDVTVQFGSTKVENRERATEQLLYDYSTQLNRFRKLRW